VAEVEVVVGQGQQLQAGEARDGGQGLQRVGLVLICGSEQAREG
jgi:hypothetical protein